MPKAMNINISGIKCDNCDYQDDSAKFEDYPIYLNKPCPLCGAPLLTQKDLDSLKRLIKIQNTINKIYKAFKIFMPENPRMVTRRIEMDGTGKMDFIIDSHKEAE